MTGRQTAIMADEDANQLSRKPQAACTTATFQVRNSKEHPRDHLLIHTIDSS